MERMNQEEQDAVRSLEGNTAWRIYRAYLLRAFQAECNGYPGIIGDQLLHQSQGRAQVLKDLTGKTESVNTR